MSNEQAWILRQRSERNDWQFECEQEQIALYLHGGTPQQRSRILDYLNTAHNAQQEQPDTAALLALVPLVVRLVETNGADYSAWQGMKLWLQDNPIPEPARVASPCRNPAEEVMRRFNTWWNTRLMRHFNPALTLWLMASNRVLYFNHHKTEQGHSFYDWWIFRLHFKPRALRRSTTT